MLREALSEVEGVVFRTVPEGGVENYSFLNFFLPTAAIAEKAQKALTEAGVDGCFYWFKNNWHYINGWEHLRNLKGMGNLPKEIQEQMQDLNNTPFPQSDHWMGRTISCLVKLSWTEAQTMERASKLRTVVQEVLQTTPV